MKNSSSNIIDYSCIDSSACCFLGLQCSIGSCRGLFGFSHTSSTDRVILNPEFDGTQWSEKLRRQLVMARVKCNFCVQLVILCRSSLLAQFPAVAYVCFYHHACEPVASLRCILLCGLGGQCLQEGFFLSTFHTVTQPAHSFLDWYSGFKLSSMNVIPLAYWAVWTHAVWSLCSVNVASELQTFSCMHGF